jgi:hypothetical protein
LPTLTQRLPGPPAAPHGPFEQSPLERGLARDLAGDRAVHLLVDSWHGWDVRGGGGQELVDDLAGIAAPEDEACAHAQNHRLGDTREHVRER